MTSTTLKALSVMNLHAVQLILKAYFISSVYKYRHAARKMRQFVDALKLESISFLYYWILKTLKLLQAHTRKAKYRKAKNNNHKNKIQQQQKQNKTEIVFILCQVWSCKNKPLRINKSKCYAYQHRCFHLDRNTSMKLFLQLG